MRTLFKVLLLTLCLLLQPCVYAETKAGAVKWENYSTAIFAQAKQSHKLILIYGKAVWCHWCQQMANTYKDPQVAETIKTHFIPVMVDVDKNADVADKYQINDLPTLIILDENNNVVQVFSGFIPPTDLNAKLQDVLK